jgi:hypothetical protein
MVRKLLITFHLLIGLAAIIGGIMAFHDPSGAMIGLTAENFKSMPFPNLIIPGCFLFIVLGIGNLLGVFLLLMQSKYQLYYSGGIGIILMLWIIIQVFMLRMIIPPHVLTFIIGFMQVIFSLKERNKIVE